jgi:hypothetical protein
VINCSLLRISKILRLTAPLLLISILAASCEWLWQWPSAKVNYDVGDSIIGQFLITKNLWSMNEEDIARGIKDILAISVSREGDARSAVESAGLRCDSLPSTTCNYMGNAVYRFFGVQKDTQYWNKQIVITVSIKLLSYTDLNNVIVRKQEIIIPAE